MLNIYKFMLENKDSQSSLSTGIKAADLRGILEYVPLYRGQIFVVAIDGSVILHENFSSIATDIEVLRSLGINIVVVYGIGMQMKTLFEDGAKISDFYGTGPVDDETLKYARQASGVALQNILDTFSARELKCASTPAVRATEMGIVSGVSQLNCGRIDRIDFKTLRNLLDLGIIPVISPIAGDREGRVFRMNSDFLAAELAAGLKASKLIFLTVTRGLAVGDEKTVAVPVNEAKSMLEKRKSEIDPRVLSKVEASVKALETSNTPRAHILDGRDFACLLTELFEKVGCGSMIYSDEYQKIRKATPDDAVTIFNISKISSLSQNLIYRPLEEIQAGVDNYFVYEIDGSIVAFVSLLDIGDGCAELASLHVQPFYQGNGVGRRMVEFVKIQAKKAGFEKLFALSTKSSPFFTELCGFKEVSSEALPEARRKKYSDSGRNSKIFSAW